MSHTAEKGLSTHIGRWVLRHFLPVFSFLISLILGIIPQPVCATTTIVGVDAEIYSLIRWNSSSFAGITYHAVSEELPTATPTNTPVPVHPDRIGVYKDGIWHLGNANLNGTTIMIALFGNPSDLPLVGDWNGDNVDTIGVYRHSEGFFFLSDSNTAPAVNYTVLFGDPGDTPFAGRWTADMTHDGIGVYRNSNGILYQKKELTTGYDDFFAVFGNPGDQGVAGDWDGDGFDSIGIYRPSNYLWYLTNNSTPSGITFNDIIFEYNTYGGAPVVGDWDGNGITSVGFLSKSTNVFYLRRTNDPQSIYFGVPFVSSYNALPIAGRWTSEWMQPPAAKVQGIIVQPGLATPFNGNYVDFGAAD